MSKKLYAYSPHTLEYIETDDIFDWMGTTAKTPPVPNENESAFFIDGEWIAKQIIHPKSEQEIRQERDDLLQSILWVTDRYEKQERINVPTTNSKEEYEAILGYMQQLRDIPEQEGFPDNVIWPTNPLKEEK